MKILFAAAALCAVVATAAVAQPGPSAGTPNQAATKSEEKSDRLVCRYIESDTGSRLRGRTRQCLTAAQWQAQSRR